MFRCKTCSAVTRQWFPKCAACGAWNTIAATNNAIAAIAAAAPSSPAAPAPRARSPLPLPPPPDPPTPDELEIDPIDPPMLASAIAASVPELPRHRIAGLPSVDAVLGGGLVIGSVVLLSADPGTGKSTLAAQIAAGIGEPTLYASGEETPDQVAGRMARLELTDRPIYVTAETDVRRIVRQAAATAARLVVVDSAQTALDPEAPGAIGSVSQVRAVATYLTAWAKSQRGIVPSVLLIAHVTKDGQIAGPKTLEHAVDAILELERPADAPEESDARVLRCPRKNRYGRTRIPAVLHMTERGLVEKVEP